MPHPRKVLLLQPSCSMNAAPPAVSTAMRSMVVALQFCSTTPSATASPWRATCARAAGQACEACRTAPQTEMPALQTTGCESAPRRPRARAGDRI